MDKPYVVGIDVGGTNTVVGIVDKRGQILTSGSIKTAKHAVVEDYLDELTELINKLIGEVTTKDQIKGIGAGTPNGNYFSGSIEFAPNLPWKGVIPFAQMLEERVGIPVALTNDANAAAIGEMVYGGAKGMKNFVMYTLGTGVGSGVVVNGDLVYGHDGFAGECGHTTLIPGGRVCGCGAKGHLEAYCSAPGMKRTAFELLAYYNAGDSLLADKSFNELSSKMIYEAAVKGDKVALEVFEKTGQYLGQGLADTVHHLSPEAIFLFGGPTAAGDYIFKPLRESLEAHLLPIFKNKIKILPSELSAGDAAIVGASALVWKEQDK